MSPIANKKQLPPVEGAELIPITDQRSIEAAGIAYPRSEWGWRWVYRHRETNGHANSFRKLGRRILVSVPDFLEAMRAQDPPQTRGRSRRNLAAVETHDSAESAPLARARALMEAAGVSAREIASVMRDLAEGREVGRDA